MNRYKECRLAMNMSQKFVALSVGVSPPMVSQWESGIKEPSKETLLKLADLFRVSTDYLLGRNANKKEPIAVGDGLADRIIRRIRLLPDPALVRVSDFLDGLQAGQAVSEAEAAAPGSADAPDG